MGRVASQPIGLGGRLSAPLTPGGNGIAIPYPALRRRGSAGEQDGDRRRCHYRGRMGGAVVGGDPEADHGSARPRWLVAAVAGLVLLQWVIFAVDAVVPSIVLFSYLNVPVLLAVGLGRPRLTGGLAVQGLLLGAVTSAINGYTEDVNGWIRFGLMAAVAVVAVALSGLIGRLNRRRRVALSRLDGALASEQDAHLLLEPVRDATGSVRDLRVVEANPVACDLLGRTRGDLLDRSLRDVLPVGVGSSTCDLCLRTVATGEPLVLDGDRVPGPHAGADRYFDVRGVWTGQVLSLEWRDVTEAVASRQRLEASEQRFRLLAQNSSDVVMLAGDDLTMHWLSPSLTVMLGWRPVDWHGRALEDFAHPDDVPLLRAHVDTVKAGAAQVMRLKVRDAFGDWHWVEMHAGSQRDEHGAVAGIVATLRQVDAQVAAEEDLRQQARQDALTGLLNRAALYESLRARERGRREGSGIGVLFCDLDRFKDVNDRYGHAAGDEVLRVVASRIERIVRDSDLVARVGGDEILVVLTGLADPGNARAIAETIRSAVTAPIAWDGDQIPITISIGVHVPDDHESIDGLVATADKAMYRAKQQGRNQVSGDPT